MPKQLNQVVEIPPLDDDATVEVLNRILQVELSGVMQHFHHRWVSRWLLPSRARAITVGQHIAALTGAPAVGVDDLMSDALASSEEMLAAVRSYEQNRVDEYRRLLELVAGRNQELEAFARAQIAAEERHLAELTFDD